MSDDKTPNHTWRVKLAYRGEAFSGWQKQDNARSVQADVEATLAHLDGGPVAVTAAGRTDAGVHAHGQVISFSLRRDLRPDKLVLALCALLPPECSALDAERFPAGFSALRHAVGKHYKYRVLTGIARDPFEAPTSWHRRGVLDVPAMRTAASALIGTHDFESFRATHCQAAHARRHIWEIAINHEGRMLVIDIRGNAFCHNMVRIIVGTLIAVGHGRVRADTLSDILSARTRRAAGQTAPPGGLSLVEVFYPDDLSRARIPEGARFPRYPVTGVSWPF